MNESFPIRHIEGNLVFTQDDQVYGYYQVPLVDYTYRSPSEKKQARLPWIRLFHLFSKRLHILVIPTHLDLIDQEQQMKQRVPNHPMRRFAHQYMEKVTQVLEQYQRPTRLKVFLGFPLDTKGKKKPHQRRKKFSHSLKDLKRYLLTTIELSHHEIFDEEIAQYQEQERILYQDLLGCGLQVQRATLYDLQQILSHSSYRGIGEPALLPHWKPKVERIDNGDHQALLPNQKDIQRRMQAEYRIHPQAIQVTRFHEGQIREGWMRFLYLSHLPDELQFPGEELIYWLQQLRFPVDVSIHVTKIPPNRALALMGRNKRKLQHHVTHTRQEGHQQDLDLEQAYQEAVREEKEMKRSRDPILETSIAFGVYAPSKEQLDQQTQQLIAFYTNRNQDIEVIVSPGDQYRSFLEFLPGSQRLVPDFTHKLKPTMVASCMINGTQILGDTQGIFVGYTGVKELDRPVFLDLMGVIEGSDLDSKSSSTLIVGSTGYGKSFTSAQLMYQSMVTAGAKVLLIDTKGERSNWVTDLPGLKGQVSLLRIGSEEKYRGMLDPFVIFPPESASLYAKDFLMQLVQVPRQHEWHYVIQEAIQKVSKQSSPSMNAIVNLIRNQDSRLYHILQMYQWFPLAQLLFGEGDTPVASLDVDKPLNIIQIDGLRVPDRTKRIEDYNELELLSKALMVPIIGFANQMMKRDRHCIKRVWWEEGWIPLASDMGERAINEGIRMGRYWNSGTLLVTQNPTDVPNSLINNMGMRMVFKTVEEEELTRAMEVLQIENSERNREAIRNLNEGEAYMRDRHGRVGRIYFDVIFPELKQAFDTTPPKEG